MFDSELEEDLIPITLLSWFLRRRFTFLGCFGTFRLWLNGRSILFQGELGGLGGFGSFFFVDQPWDMKKMKLTVSFPVKGWVVWQGLRDWERNLSFTRELWRVRKKSERVSLPYLYMKRNHYTGYINKCVWHRVGVSLWNPIWLLADDDALNN